MDIQRMKLNDTDWMALGNCADTDPRVFFPSTGLGVIAAQAVCRHCPVKETCLQYALDTNQNDGVWGGLSERQRKGVNRRRRAASTITGYSLGKDQQSPTDDVEL